MSACPEKIVSHPTTSTLLSNTPLEAIILCIPIVHCVVMCTFTKREMHDWLLPPSLRFRLRRCLQASPKIGRRPCNDREACKENLSIRLLCLNAGTISQHGRCKSALLMKRNNICKETFQCRDRDLKCMMTTMEEATFDTTTMNF